jgi:FixJ family two-component response regulator
MSGRELKDQVSKRDPNIKILFMSGYTDESITYNGILDSGAAFIEKPFSPGGLARKVREVLESP